MRLPGTLDIVIHSGDIRDRSLKLSKIAPNFTLLASIIFGEGLKSWDLGFKMQPTSNHVAKFHGNQPVELVDLALKETSAVKHKTTWYYTYQVAGCLTKQSC